MAFQGWDKLDGEIVGPPAVQALSSGSVIVFARGIDDHMWSREVGGGAWARVDDDLKLESAPTVDNHLHADGLLDIAAVADGQQVWVKSNGVSNHGAAWRLIGGGKAVGEVAVVARQSLFVRGLDDHLWRRPLAPDRPWYPMDTHWRLTSPPGVSVRDYGTVYKDILPGGDEHRWYWELAVAAAAVAPGRKVDGIWVKTYQSRTREWQDGWFDRGGRCKGAPAIGGVDGLPLFVRGLDDFLWSDWGGTWRCVSAELKLTSSPGVAVDRDVAHIVVRGPDAAVYYAAWDAPAH